MLGMDVGKIVGIALLLILSLSLFGSLFKSARMRNALIWVLIFGSVIFGAGGWDEISRSFFQHQATFTEARVEVPKGRDNHFRLTLQINGIDVDFLVDTGASQVVLNQADAARVGLNPDTLAYIGIAQTANGEVATAPVRLDRVDLGDISDTQVRASVNSGQMENSLLGMSYLSRFESIEIRRDVLILNR
ncbi:retropepsin-like aspartic protease family protein [Octadecabacter antarcticus]|nr:TIGR02281 family clan AA aspartic protease [Octadecabacter antarcticus]